jgi:hypothetical protein
MTIYVRLLHEGTEAARLAEAVDIGAGLFRILSAPDYDPQDEEWAFLPGSVVRCEPRQDPTQGEYLLAVKP